MIVRRQFLFSCMLVVTICSLQGCMVGPDFHPLSAPLPNSYTHKPLPKHTTSSPSLGQAGKSQTYIVGKDISSRWWKAFESSEIDELVDLGIRNSPTLEAAYAALRQAQELLNVQIGNSLFPAVNANASAIRERGVAASTTGSFGAFATPGSFDNIFNVFNANLNVSYTLDIFGGARRQIESLAAQVDYQQFQLIAAYMTIATNVVITVVNMASLQAQIESNRALVRSQTRQLNIFKGQYRLGGISLENVVAQETILGQTRAILPPLEKNLAQQHNILAVLTGSLPNVNFSIPKLSAIHLPKNIPISIPSRFVRQRPDIRAQEALVHAASANIGVATANLLPQVAISGSYGWESSVLSNLFSPKNLVWNMAVSATQAVFHGGALIAARRAAVAAYDQALAQYKQTVLTAFQNISDSLRQLETDSRTLHETRYAENAAAEFLNLTNRQYQLGGASYLAIIIAEQSYRQATIARIQAEATRFVDMATLFQALGGGWWNKGWCVAEEVGINECV